MNDVPETSAPGENPPSFHGWQITLSHGKGPFGAETCVATAEKAGARISAAAWRPDLAVEMITSMIRQRENIPYSRPTSVPDEKNPKAPPLQQET